MKSVFENEKHNKRKMKEMINKLGFILAALMILSFLFSCEENKDPMEAGIVDMNNKITSMDKTVAEPGNIVTVTGTDLDKVFKIMLNEDIVPVVFTATSTELKFTIPSLTPLGDVVTVTFFFSGKGIAQRTLKIISPPIIMDVSPIAAHPGDIIKVAGRELHLTQSITVGGLDATSSIVLIDDKLLTIEVPTGFTGGNIVITTETGGLSESPLPLILGTELLVTNVDENGSITSSYGPYSNATGTTATEDFPRNMVYVITIVDNASSWGANCDFYLQNMPADIGGVPIDLDKVDMVADIKASKNLTINYMVGKNHNPPGLWGKKINVTQTWDTYIVPFSELGEGYDNLPITGDPLIPFEQYTMIKWSLPARTSDNNFGETITFDNVKFIIRD